MKTAAEALRAQFVAHRLATTQADASDVRTDLAAITAEVHPRFIPALLLNLGYTTDEQQAWSYAQLVGEQHVADVAAALPYRAETEPGIDGNESIVSLEEPDFAITIPLHAIGCWGVTDEDGSIIDSPHGLMTAPEIVAAWAGEAARLRGIPEAR